jgi:hypothetical protein
MRMLPILAGHSNCAELAVAVENWLWLWRTGCGELA